MNAKLLICAVTMTVLVAGCRAGWEPDYSKLGLVNVTGKVTLDGQPLAQVTVIFECADKTYSYGKTDDNGYYRLMFDSDMSGALPGPKVVRIQSDGAGEESVLVEGSDGKVAQASDVSIPSCYGSMSKLTATVEGSSQTLHFDLKSDCSVTGPTS